MTKEKKQSPWGIDRLNEQVQGISDEQQKALHEECVLFAQCFGTEAGRKVLQILTDSIDKQPTWSPHLEPKFGYFREGQNDILRNIKTRINFARSR